MVNSFGEGRSFKIICQKRKTLIVPEKVSVKKKKDKVFNLKIFGGLIFEKIDSAIAICKRILLTRSLDFVLSA